MNKQDVFSWLRRFFSIVVDNGEKWNTFASKDEKIMKTGPYCSQLPTFLTGSKVHFPYYCREIWCHRCTGWKRLPSLVWSYVTLRDVNFRFSTKITGKTSSRIFVSINSFEGPGRYPYPFKVSWEISDQPPWPSKQRVGELSVRITSCPLNLMMTNLELWNRTVVWATCILAETREEIQEQSRVLNWKIQHTRTSLTERSHIDKNP